MAEENLESAIDYLRDIEVKMHPHFRFGLCEKVYYKQDGYVLSLFLVF